MKSRSMTYIPIMVALVLLIGDPLLADEEASHFQKSYDLEQQSDYQGAMLALEGLDEAARDGYVYHLRMGWLLYLQGELDQSISSYKKAIAEQPDAVEPLLGLMLPQMAQRLWKDTVETALLVLDRDSMNYLANSRLAYAYFNLGRFAQAEQTYDKMVSSYPSDTEMRAGLAWSQCKQGKMLQAQQGFGLILSYAPQHPSALEGIASCN